MYVFTHTHTNVYIHPDPSDLTHSIILLLNLVTHTCIYTDKTPPIRRSHYMYAHTHMCKYFFYLCIYTLTHTWLCTHTDPSDLTHSIILLLNLVTHTRIMYTHRPLRSDGGRGYGQGEEKQVRVYVRVRVFK